MFFKFKRSAHKPQKTLSPDRGPICGSMRGNLWGGELARLRVIWKGKARFFERALSICQWDSLEEYVCTGIWNTESGEFQSLFYQLGQKLTDDIKRRDCN